MSLSVNIKKKIEGVTLDVAFEAENEFFAVLGESGCGKSLTLRCIAGIERPDTGKIVLNGKVLFDSEKHINLPPQKRKIGYLFQDYALFPNMTVEENIGIGIEKKRRKEEVARFVKMFFLEGFEKKYPYMLSGGQKQRVAIARILILNPEMILLDEPFSAVDSYLKWKLEQQIMELAKLYNSTILFVSHNRDEVYRLCDKMAVIHNGKVEVTGEKKEIFKNPRTVSAAILTGCKNITEMVTEGQYIYCKDWNIRKRIVCSEKVIGKALGIRAHDIKVIKEREYADAKCVVEDVIESTFDMIYLLRPDGAKKPLRMQLPKSQVLVYHEKEEVYISLWEEALLFLQQ